VAVIAVPGLRDFYAFDIPETAAVVAAACVAAGAVICIEIGWIISQRRQEPDSRTARVAWKNPAATANPDA
jgi:hypothetical protein